MPRYNDQSPYLQMWTNRKLITRLREYMSLDNAAIYLPQNYIAKEYPGNDTPAIQEALQIHKQTWIDPIITEIEKRFVKVK